MFNFFSTNPCGVKISDSVVEIMELSEDRVVETYGRKLLDEEAVEEGEILEEEKVVEALRELLDETGVSTERAVLTLPTSKIDLERVDFDEELEEHQIEQEVIDRVDDSSRVQDFMELESEEGTSILIVTADQEDVETYSELVEKAGLEVVRIEPEQLALGRALLKTDGEIKAVVNLDFESTTLGVFGGNKELKFFREIDFSGKELTQVIADKEGISLKEAKQLKYKFGLNESKRSNDVPSIIKEELESFLEDLEEELGFYETNFDKIGQIILSGRSALVPGLGDHVAEQLGRMVRIGNPMVNLQNPSYLGEEDTIHPVVFASVIGLSLSEIEDYEGRIDLLTPITHVEEVSEEEPEEEEEEEEEEIKEEVVVGGKSRFDVGKLIKGVGISLLVIALGIAGYLFVPDLVDWGGGEVTEKPERQQEKEPQEEKEQEPKQPVEETEEEEPEPEPEPVVKTMVTIQETPTGWLRVRGGPGTGYDELDKVDPGQEFPMASQDGEWYEIELPYGNGWVYGDYIETSTTTVSE